jgi:hypothetical protein
MLMTDTFSSGFSTPPAAARGAAEPTGDVTTTLAELERKLRELERELTSIGRRRVRPEGTGAETFAAPAAGTLSDQVSLAADARLVDERVEPPRAPEPQRAPEPPRSPEPPIASDFGEERPRPTEAQLATLAELRRFGERLERFTKELTTDYESVLARVMAVLSGRPMPEPPSSEPAPAVSEEPLFEGRVELGVGPFYDIGSLGAFEQQVAQVPNVGEVSIRRFEASHAVVDLRLEAPVALLSELRRVLDTEFGIRQVAPGRIVLSFDEV